uniref:Uncharacterized protein n=1 Tax=Timema tahoe TaxID=61484 RepID=A0A7R9IIJ8_9NEOP|nr:unnamed protein product [Timema tahoe]
MKLARWPTTPPRRVTLSVRCKRKGELQVTEIEQPTRGYRHATAHLVSQATFSWLTGLLWVGYCSPLEIEDLGQLPEEETTERQLHIFNCIYEKEKATAKKENRRLSLWKCYFKSCWRKFALGGLFKLLGDFVGFVGPLGIMVILDYVAAIQKPTDNIIDSNKRHASFGAFCLLPLASCLIQPDLFTLLHLSPCVRDVIADHYPTWSELLSNGYFMGLIVFLSALAQGTLSQSSTHLINVEGIHLKGALQALVYIKALRLCVWSISEHKDEEVSSSPEKKDARPNGSVSPPGNCPSDTKIKGTPGTDVGAITNLMSEDAFNVMSFFWIGHYIWAIPLKKSQTGFIFQICVLMYFLYLKLGWSAIIGAAFCILTMTPLQFLIGKKMSSNSKAITELSDERLRRMNEVLQGIKLLKLYGWECIYGSRILETRKRELRLLDKDAVYWALLTFLTHASSVLVTLVTFGVYFSMEEGALSPGNVFTGLALFNQLTVPLFIFPITVPVIISAMVSHRAAAICVALRGKVSTKRLEDFLSLPETSDPISQNEPQEHPDASDINKEDKESRIEEEKITKTSVAPVEALHNNTEVVMGRPQSDDNLFGLGNILEGEEHPDDEEGGEVHPEEDEAALTIERALFSWSADSTKSVLGVDDVSIMKGKNVSSLRHCHSDTTVAYAAQKPWLLNATLRDNILFGQAYRPRRYKRVIGACALQPDIDILPGKDLTEIGEKGINMSGGQKQRIAVARALYSQANVVVLVGPSDKPLTVVCKLSHDDDPLSALDYQVGQQVFEEGIRRMLLRQRRTVILVTHRLQLLSYAHKIIAVEQGSVRAQGNLSEIESVDPELVRTWKATMSREALEGQRNVGGRTAKERWKLVKLVSRIGVQLKQRNVADGTWQTDEETHVRARRAECWNWKPTTAAGAVRPEDLMNTAWLAVTSVSFLLAAE